VAGIFGFYAFGEEREKWNALTFIYYGLQALQGRGQETTSIAWTEPDGGIRVLTREGRSDGIEIDGRRGFVGLGMVSAYKDDYAIVVNGPLRLVLAGDGKPALADDRGAAFKELAERLSARLAEGGDYLSSTVSLLEEIRGGFSFIALVEGPAMIAARSRLGVKPLEVGSIGFDIGCISSESAALDVVGASHSYSLKPGEVVLFDNLSIRRARAKGSREAFCAFEYVYLARPDSRMNDIQVYDVREAVGRALAELGDGEAEVVIGVPETAIPMALEYSRTRGLPCKLGFVRTGTHVRSALKTTQLERLIGLQLKLNPIQSSIDDKDIVLIDDSVVRGNTLKNTVINLKRRGARRIHVRVGSPPIVSHCPFGTEIPPRDELIARDLSEEEISEVIGCDSFAYLPVEKLVEAIGMKRSSLCLGCFTGEYPEERAE